MIPADRWRQLEPILDAALDRAPADRSRFLRDACGGNVDMRQDIERLLEDCEQPLDFFETGGGTRFAALLTDSAVADPKAPAVLAGRYRIIRLLAHGGMASVYLAEDTRHARQVAVKLLSAEVSATMLRTRFLEEIQIAAKLVHPNIVSVHDSGEADGFLFYVMPYVEGESLRERLRREKHLSLDEALRITTQVADALAHAHERGIVHRDVKPENILFEAGHAVVCDFGIARAIEIAAAERLTDSGVILGTPAYMSPEQMTREPQIDGRSDVYSVACVLYEMLAGCLPFSRPPGRILFETANANAPQPLSRVRRDVPAGVAQVIDRALARSPDDRFDSVSAFTAALASARAAQATKRRLRKQVIGSGVTVAAVAVAVVSWNSRSLGRATPIERQLTFSGNTSEASLSPDGRFIAYVAQAGDSQNVVVQDVEAGGKAITVYSSSNVGTLDWSPDGTRIVVASYNHPKNSIAIVPRLGGAVQYFSIRPANHAYWLPDGKHLTVYAAGQQRLLIIDSDGGDSTRLTIPGKYTWMWQGNWSPDGRVFALVTEWYNPWKFQILTVSRSGAVQVVAEDSMPLGSPRWSGDGKYLYYGRGTQTIWRVPVSTRTGTRTGEPENVPANLEARVSNLGGLSFSVARAGHHMAYTRGLSFSQVVLVERGSTSKNPRTTQLTTGTAQRWWPVVSPDGRSVAYAEASSGPAELWRMPIEGGTPTQLTNGARVKTFSQTAWGPDGSHIAFETVRGGFGEVWTADVRNGQLRRYAHTSMGMIYSHLEWAPGPDIVYSTPDQFDQQILNPATGDQLVLTSDSRMHVVRGPLQHDQADLGCVESPRYSPDARRLAVLRCDGRGGSSLWLFDLHDSTTTKLADLPGLFPRSWSSDGRYVYAQYQMGGNRITRLDARGVRPPEIFVELPVRGAQCSPAGKLRPNAFVCVVNDFTSDIVLIENFDARG